MSASGSLAAQWLFYLGFRKHGRVQLKLFPENIMRIKNSAFSEFCIQHEEFADLLFDKETRISPTNEGELPLLGWMLELMWAYQLSKQSGFSGHLLRDHGFSQLALSVFPYRSKFALGELGDAVAEYFRTMPAPDLVIVLRTQVLDAAERLSKRGYPARMKALAKQERDAVLVNADRCLMIGIEEMKKRKIRFIEIENEQSKDALVLKMKSITQNLTAF